MWLPTWSTDRLRRNGGSPGRDLPLVTRAHDGRKLVVAAADQAALALGLHPGLSLAEAQARVPGLLVTEADPAGDTAALGRLATWCLRYAPLTAPAPADGVWLDIAGCAHLHGGEAELLHNLLGRLRHVGIAARAAVAGTPGAAHAVARHGHDAVTVVAPRDEVAALTALAVSALRLPMGMVGGLSRLGLDRVGQLLAAPRAPLARRFGPELHLRLDQATGAVREPLEPVLPSELVQHRLTFVEPLISAEALGTVIARLVPAVCTVLERAGQGARQLDLLFERVDGTVAALRVGTAKPNRDPRHLGRMFDERLEEVDPQPGVEAMRLVVTVAEPLAWAQQSASLDGERPVANLAGLVDRLCNRLGAERVFQVRAVESDIPERSVQSVPALASAAGRGIGQGAGLPCWPAELPRPVRLFSPPQEVDAIAQLPDRPPAVFTWRRVRRRVRHADGPERVYGEWWHADDETGSVRDYWRVEDETGCRYWLFRRGDGADPATGDLRWFLHGLF